jgi:hypothetical protein
MARAVSLAVLPAFLLLAGCGGNTKLVVRHPQWNYERYERIAVVPVRAADRRAAHDAEQVTSLLTDLLVRNGQFQVCARRELADVMREQDLANTDFAAPGALPSGLIQVAQALVVADITDYTCEGTVTEEKVPVFARDRQGRTLFRNGVPVVHHYETVPIYRAFARVGGSVRVIDVASGQVLFAHPSPPIEREEKRRGRAPDESPEQLASDAALELAQDFYTNVAPIAVKVKFKSSSLLVATGYFEGKYDETNKVPSDLSAFALAVRDLAPACDRNVFRVAITPRDGREFLFGGPVEGYTAEPEGQFIWSGGLGERGWSASVPVARLERAGTNKYTAKLYVSGSEEPALERDFEIVAAKNGRDSRDESRNSREERGSSRDENRSGANTERGAAPPTTEHGATAPPTDQPPRDELPPDQPPPPHPDEH